MNLQYPPKKDVRVVIGPVMCDGDYLRVTVCNHSAQWVEEKRIGPTITGWEKVKCNR